MAGMLVDERDQKFVLFEQLEIDKLSDYELYSEFDKDVYLMVLSEAKKLAENEFMPLNSVGDTEGVVFKDGKVIMPESFHRLWALWNEGEWRGLDIPAEYGGQGMPTVLGMAANEFFEAANLAFQMSVAMPRGGALLIAQHGSDEQRAKYVDKILTGEWSSTMALTEAEAGSDVGATRTIAERNEDGTYSIKGAKVFITCGDMDLAKNIIHLALARVKGAPAGTKGLSLFLVPKYKINSDGSPGEPNDIKVVSVEKKLGLKASPTCQLSFGEENNCTGELIGRENQGMTIFFTMMNESRLIAARHGAGIASSAYIHALEYSRERLQGSQIGKESNRQSPIIKHPDIRRMLTMMKSYTEGVRALIYYSSYCIDRVHVADSKEEKQKWEKRLGFLTPVTKAYGTELSFRVTEAALQVYGGYGYTKDYPIEQFLRDEKVHSIFEGTNGIQALDLAGRKLSRDSNDLYTGLLKDITEFCTEYKEHSGLKAYISILDEAKKALAEASVFLLELQKKDFELFALYANQYLELFGDVIVGWLLLWQAVIAWEKLSSIAGDSNPDNAQLENFVTDNVEAAFYSGKLGAAKFFISNVVSLASAKAAIIRIADRSALQIAENAFVV
ncbi:MAG: acyl-CoA dehydrogenase [Spirochaetes bacterium]|nr:acyl-CoA dehydrogenase [Spirochaetota bacterium]